MGTPRRPNARKTCRHSRDAALSLPGDRFCVRWPSLRGSRFPSGCHTCEKDGALLIAQGHVMSCRGLPESPFAKTGCTAVGAVGRPMDPRPTQRKMLAFDVTAPLGGAAFWPTLFLTQQPATVHPQIHSQFPPHLDIFVHSYARDTLFELVVSKFTDKQQHPGGRSLFRRLRFASLSASSQSGNSISQSRLFLSASGFVCLLPIPGLA